MKILVSILFLFFGSSLALACSCMLPDDKSRAEALKNSPVIFQGKVIAIHLASSGGNQTKVKFHVRRAWKGVRTNEIVVATPSDSAACGYAFEKDKIYTVYATGNPLSTNSCLMLQVDESRITETFGEGKEFEEQPPPKVETADGFWSRFWRKIASLFS